MDDTACQSVRQNYELVELMGVSWCQNCELVELVGVRRCQSYELVELVGVMVSEL